MKLWILGADGLLGRALTKLCAKLGVSAISTGKAQADITCREMLFAKAQEISPTHMINCAAYTDVDKAESQYDTAFQINAVGAQHVAEAAHAVDARLVHISTDFVFDDTCGQPFCEETEAKPINAYGKSKWEGEKRVLAVHPEACIIRTSWLFGTGGKNFFSVIKQLLQTKEEIGAVEDQWGCPTYAPDLACAVLHLLDHSGIYHFAHPNSATRFEVAEFAWQEMLRQGIPLACKKVQALSQNAFPLAAPRPLHSALSTKKYAQATGETPRVWQEAMQEFISHA